MDYMKILKRAWEITWRYRALWVFGIILALTTASPGGGNGGGGGGGGSGGNGNVVPPQEFHWPPERIPDPLEELRQEWEELPDDTQTAIIVAGVSLTCLILLTSVVFTIGRYVAGTAMIRMVDDYEETGEKRSIRQGFRMGWSRAAWRMFLIHLLVSLPIVLVFILLFLIACAPLLLWTTGEEVVGVVGTIVTVGLVFVTVMLAIVVAAVISLLLEFFWRACALEDRGVTDSIRTGFEIVKNHLKDVVIMALIMVGIQIGLALLMIPAAILLIPAVLLLIAVGLLVIGLPALLLWALLSLLFSHVVALIIAAVFALPLFILIIAAPFTFIGGLIEVFRSSVWTLTFRELRALESMAALPPVFEEGESMEAELPA